MEAIYYTLIRHVLLPEKRKDAIRETRGTGHLQYIDQIILKDWKARKNAAIEWIYYEKSYDMVPQS